VGIVASIREVPLVAPDVDPDIEPDPTPALAPVLVPVPAPEEAAPELVPELVPDGAVLGGLDEPHATSQPRDAMAIDALSCVRLALLRLSRAAWPPP
jgi:hypothetical protein